MKYFVVLLLGSVFFFSSCFSARKAGKIADLKVDAKEFSFGIIRAYFEEDCDRVYKSFSDSIILMDGDGIFSIEGMEDKICESVKSAVRDNSKTIVDYLAMYQIKMYTPLELETELEAQLPDYYIPDPSDVFYVGGALKPEEALGPNFIWDDMFVFMVRREGSVWKIKGVSG